MQNLKRMSLKSLTKTALSRSVFLGVNEVSIRDHNDHNSCCLGPNVEKGENISLLCAYSTLTFQC